MESLCQDYVTNRLTDTYYSYNCLGQFQVAVADYIDEADEDVDDEIISPAS